MKGTQCCGAGIITTTHQHPSWHTCANCGQPVTITGKPLRPEPGDRKPEACRLHPSGHAPDLQRCWQCHIGKKIVF